MAEGFGNKLKKFANNPFVRYGAAAATGGIPGLAAMGARDLYKHVTNKPVGLGSLPAPHPALSVGSPEVLPPPPEVPLGHPNFPGLTPAPSAPAFGLAGLSRPVDTSALGITKPNFPTLTPGVSVPDGPVDTSSLGIGHPASLGNPDLTTGVAQPPPASPTRDPFPSNSFGNNYSGALSIGRDELFNPNAGQSGNEALGQRPLGFGMKTKLGMVRRIDANGRVITDSDELS